MVGARRAGRVRAGRFCLRGRRGNLNHRRL